MVHARQLSLERDQPNVVRGGRAPERHDLVVFGHVHRDGIGVEEAGDLLRGGATVRDGLDDRRRRRTVVTADEDLRSDRLVRLGVDLDVPPSLHPEFGKVLREPARLGRLPQCEEHGVTGDFELGARYGDRAPAAFLVRVAELVADEDDAAHVSVRVGEDLDRRGEIHKLNALALGLGQFLLVDDHLFAAAADDDVHVLRSEAPRGGRAVHSGVPRAEDDHALPHLDRPAAVRALEEHDAGHHTIRLLAGDADVVRLEAARGDEHGVIFVVQLSKRDIAPDERRET